ncbi:MAG: SDR family oxidoreductase [Propionibacteriales bacterium]|nr:SDR family oxidoreductase [Propionibacteriales bacterium]
MRRSGTFDLDGKVVAITGGARGIGRSTAAAFAARGARVAIGDVDSALAQATAAELGVDVVGLPLDVRDRASFADFLDQVEHLLGPLDILVNNAGIMPTGRHTDESDALTDQQIAINVLGVVTGSKLAARRFAARGLGHLINIASLAAVNPTAGLATYCGTKHFVLGYTESLHRELSPLGIGVTAILPGVVRTELSAGANVPGWAEKVAVVDPEAIAAAVVDAVGSGRLRAARPRVLNATVQALGLLPARARLRAERLTGFDELMTHADPVARAAYHRRIGGGS